MQIVQFIIDLFVVYFGSTSALLLQQLYNAKALFFL